MTLKIGLLGKKIGMTQVFADDGESIPVTVIQTGPNVVVGTRTGYLFAWKTKGKSDGAVEWESFHHDNANTGNYATKLDPGRVQKASKPLDCSVPAPPVEEKYEAAGCTCDTTKSARTSGAWAGGLAALGAIVTALALDAKHAVLLRHLQVFLLHSREIRTNHVRLVRNGDVHSGSPIEHGHGLLALAERKVGLEQAVQPLGHLPQLGERVPGGRGGGFSTK